MRIFVGLFLLLALPGFAVAFGVQVAHLWDAVPLCWSIGGGACLGILLDEFLVRKIPGAETFEHELTHAVAATVLFRRIDRFVVTRHHGGFVSHSGGFGGDLGNDFIGLAPYVIPTFTFVSVLSRPFMPPGWFPWFDVWVGVTFGFNLWSTRREIAENWSSRTFESADGRQDLQTDIASRGFLYSAVFILSSTLAIHGLVVAVLLEGSHGLRTWWTLAWSVTNEVVIAMTVGAMHVSRWLSRLAP